MKNNQAKVAKMGFIESIYDVKIVGVENRNSRIYKLKNTKKDPDGDLTDANYFQEKIDLLSRNSIICPDYPSFVCVWKDEFATKAAVAVDHPYAFEFENFDLSGDNNIKKNESLFLCDMEIKILNHERKVLKNCINSVVVANDENEDIVRTIVDSEWRDIMKAYLKKSPFKEKIRSKKVA